MQAPKLPLTRFLWSAATSLPGQPLAQIYRTDEPNGQFHYGLLVLKKINGEPAHFLKTNRYFWPLLRYARRELL